LNLIFHDKKKKKKKNPYFVVGPKTFRLSKVTAGFSPVPIVILTLEVLKSD